MRVNGGGTNEGITTIDRNATVRNEHGPSHTPLHPEEMNARKDEPEAKDSATTAPRL